MNYETFFLCGTTCPFAVFGIILNEMKLVAINAYNIEGFIICGYT